MIVHAAQTISNMYRREIMVHEEDLGVESMAIFRAASFFKLMSW